ncbi:MAG: M48 family metalloprotease [Acidobacteria bacterium]|nr:M48 family metalloprotease [Acidobacteriota bacterium]
MYALLCICLSLSALLALNALASALAGVVWRALAPRVQGWDARGRARLLFALRVSPPGAAAALAFALIVPAYLLYEPQDSGEGVSVKLLMLACVAAAGVLLAAWRVARTWLATRRLARDWLRHAEPFAVEGARVPAFRIRHSFPVIAVIGVLRPRLFVAAQVFEALAPEELAAALAHERGHVEGRDNLKRALLQAGEDALLHAPLGRSLRREWQRESEMAADEFAAAAGPASALDLAAAIVKISKLIPRGSRPTLPAGAHLLGDGEDGTSRRVRNLLRLASQTKGTRSHTRSTPAAVLCLCLLAAGTLLLTRPAVLKLTHDAMEQVVAQLR